ncbi:MAG TPA: IS66 family insertion sequence hypothetical protein [Gammaproteobacteria bacterium]|nr:IS66 family insertion sequence hypothetical protein [Gammaproteobacteria bacterium]
MKTTEQIDTDNTAAPQPLADHWEEHLQDWQQSNQSQSAYCREHGLNYHRFTYWRRKLMPKDNESIKASAGTGSGFVPVTGPSAGAVSGLTATLPNGVQLQGITADNLDVVKPLLGLSS